MKKTMKKMFLLAAMAVASLTANAQVWLGGSLGVSYEKQENDNKDFVFSLAPSVGYNLSEDWAIAIDVNFGFNSTSPKVGDATNTITLGANPYARYTFARAGVASFFLDLGGGIDVEKPKNVDATTFWYVGVRPGVAFAITDHVSFVGRSGFLGYRGRKDYTYIGLNANNELLSVGLYYTF